MCGCLVFPLLLFSHLMDRGLCIGLVCSFPLLPWRLASQPRRREVTASYNSIQLTNTCTHNSKMGLERRHTHTHTLTKYIYTLMHATNSSFNPKGTIYNRSITSKGCVSATGNFIGPFTILN